MTKQELVDAVVKAAKVEVTKKDALALTDALFDTLKSTIKKEKRFAYPGFGTFTVRERKARVGRNPRTKEPIKIPKSKGVSFKAAAQFKSVVNK